MKKFLLIATILFAGFVAQAQSVTTRTFRTGIGTRVDSITCISTTPNYLYVSPTAADKTAVVQIKVTRVSAAIGGTAFLEASVDGTNWHNASYAAGDTVTVANTATQYLIIKIPPPAGVPWLHYRIKNIGASGDTMRVRAIWCARQ